MIFWIDTVPRLDLDFQMSDIFWKAVSNGIEYEVSTDVDIFFCHADIADL